MSEYISKQSGFIWISLIFVSVIVSFIAGCGPSAGVGTGGTGSILGYVADGYLVNATVFLDKNGNYQWDAGEPSTTTDTNGAYKLNVDSADIGKYPIVALAIKGVTIDKDTNQTVANSYVLSMPKEGVSGTISNNFISPITSQLREMLETGLYANMQHATDTLRTKMALPAGTDMMSDFVATSNNAMHAIAQNMANLMGSQMVNVISSSGSSTSVDVNRYRTMMGTIFSNMSSVKGGNAQTAVAAVGKTMTAVLTSMPSMGAGQPYKNMSTAFRGIMRGGNVINSNPPTSGDQNVCTQEAMQCPNGSWVGRSGPKCEFVCTQTQSK